MPLAWSQETRAPATAGEAGADEGDGDNDGEGSDQALPSTDKLFEQVFGRRQGPGQPSLEVPLVIDGIDRGTIDIEVADDPFETKMDRQALVDQVVDFLNEEGTEQFFALPFEDDKMMAGTLFEIGIMAEFDNADLVLRIDIDPQLRRPLPLNMSNRGRPPTSLTDPLGPAPTSAYVNVRTGLDHVHETTGTGKTGKRPVRVDLAGAIAVPRAALDYRFSYNENSTRPWQRGDLRVLQDFPESAMRWTYGDLNFPTTNYQAFVPMAGVTLARNYTLQPYVVTEPVTSNEFVLRTASQVEVVINGATVRTFRLPAGRYDLRDLPLGSGVNDVVLRITNDVGEVEETTYSLFFDSSLLATDIDQFSASLGLPAEERSGTQTYDTSKVTFSGDYRRGVTNTLTLGADFQANKIQQLLGGQALWATRIGTFESRLAGSYVEGANADIAARIGYRVRGTQSELNRNFDLSLAYTGQRFAALGSTQPNNNTVLDTAVRYSQRLPMKLSGSLGATHRFTRNNGRNSGSVSGALSRQLARGANLSLDVQRRRDSTGPYENRAFVSLNVSLAGTGQTISSTRDSQTGVSRLDWNYRPESIIGGVAATAGLQRDAGKTRATGELSRTGYRAETSISHDMTMPRTSQTEAERVTSARLGTALVFAGGHFAVTRPVTDGFAIIVPHPSLKGQTVGINPRGDRAYVAEADVFGPAVVPDLSSYQIRRVLVDVPDLAIGAELGQDVFDVIPTVRSGTVINIGTSASVLITFKVVDDLGGPVALQAGEISRPGNAAFAPLLVFSDRAGVMTSDGLTAGTYELTLFAFPDLPITFQIGDDAVGIVDLGTFRVTATPADGAASTPETPTPAPQKPDADDLAPVQEADADRDAPQTVPDGKPIDTEIARAEPAAPPADTRPQPPATDLDRGASAGIPRELADPPQNIGHYRVQLAAFRTPREAERAWDGIRAQHDDLLGNLDPVIVEVDLGRRGVFYRLQVRPLAEPISARQLCRTLQERGQSCLVIAPAGAEPIEQPPAPGQERADNEAEFERDEVASTAEATQVPAVPVAPVAVTPVAAPARDQAVAPVQVTDPSETQSPAHQVQLGSLQSTAAADAEWRRLVEKHPALLATLTRTVVPVDLGPARGTFHRLQAGPLADRSSAQALCAALRRAGQPCIEVAPAAGPVGRVNAPATQQRSDAGAIAPPALRLEDRVLRPTEPGAVGASNAAQLPAVNATDGQPDATIVISSDGSSVSRAETDEVVRPTNAPPSDASQGLTQSPPRPQYRLHLATLASAGAATAELGRLRRDLGRALSGLETDVVPSSQGAEDGSRYRIEAGAFDSRDAALAACRPIQSSGRPCLVVEATTNDRRVAQSGVGPLSLLRSPQ